MTSATPPATSGRLVVVGGGPAGLEAVRGYRDAGGDGEVVLLTADEHPPYSRPPLSKEYLRGEAGEDDLPLEDAGFYRDYDVDVRLRHTVSSMDLTSQTVTVDGAGPLAYSACVLAMGASPKPLPVPGATDTGALYLRSRSDATRLRHAAESAGSAVVIGSGFIGCEAAASLARRGVDVTLVTVEEQPQGARLGEVAGVRLREWLDGEGVAIRSGVEVEAMERGCVHLAGAEDAEGELILVAGGVEPNTAIARQAGLVVESGRIVVDARMRTSRPGVFAGGDAVLAFNASAGRHLAVEHWGEALAMGKVAGEVAAGRDSSWAEVPGFWSTIGDRNLQYAARGDGYDEARLTDHRNGSFTVWYGQGGVTVGVLTHDADDDYDEGRRRIEEHRPLP